MPWSIAKFRHFNAIVICSLSSFCLGGTTDVNRKFRPTACGVKGQWHSLSTGWPETCHHCYKFWSMANRPICTTQEHAERSFVTLLFVPNLVCPPHDCYFLQRIMARCCVSNRDRPERGFNYRKPRSPSQVQQGFPPSSSSSSSSSSRRFLGQQSLLLASPLAKPETDLAPEQ